MLAKERMDQDDPLLPQTIRDAIGDIWYSILKHADYCSGLSVQELVSVLNPAFRGWHNTVYPVQSSMGHGGDAMQHIGDADDGIDFCWKMFSNRKEVSAVLLGATSLFLSGLHLLQQCIHFGRDNDAAIEEMKVKNSKIESKMN